MRCTEIGADDVFGANDVFGVDVLLQVWCVECDFKEMGFEEFLKDIGRRRVSDRGLKNIPFYGCSYREGTVIKSFR